MKAKAKRPALFKDGAAIVNQAWSGFGLATLKMEGCAIHPDEIESELTDEQYVRQALKYLADTGDKNIDNFCRVELVKEALK